MAESPSPRPNEQQEDDQIKTVPAEKIDRRNGGCGVIFENKLYVWGGNGTDIRYPYREMAQNDSDESEDSDSDDSDDEELDPNFEIKTVVTLPRPNDSEHPFDVLDLSTHMWFRQSTSGDYPTLGLGSSLNIHHPSQTFILFSGFKDVQFDCEVYKVSPATDWVWEIVRLRSAVKPSERYMTGVIIHDDRMCVFGGVGKPIREIGDPPCPQDPGGRYIQKIEDGVERDYGWTNEYLEFLINSNEWVAPLERDAFRPDPLGSHTFSKFDSHRAVLFGGNNTTEVYTNTCYLFDLNTRVWTGPFKPAGPAHPWPIGTRFATLTSLVDPERVWHEMYEGCGQTLKPKMILLWGKIDTTRISPESWLLEFDLDHPNKPLLWTWLTIGVEPRSWHIAEPIYSDQTTSCDIVIFGGNHYKYPGTSSVERDNAAHLQILRFGVSSLEELCLAVVISSQELMDLARQGYRTIITRAQARHQNCPLTTDITHC